MSDASALAPALWGIPVVADAAARDAAFPVATRSQNQRVFNITTGNVERWSSSAWVIDLSGASAGTGSINAAIATANAYTDAARPQSGRTPTTLAAYLGDNAEFNVLDYGAVADGTSSSGTEFSTAFNAAYAAALVSGGVVKIPPGPYYHNAGISQDHTNHFVKVKIEAHGAEIFSGPSVTGSAFKFANAPQPHGLVIDGLKINHRNNTTAAAGIELSAMSHSVIRDVTWEGHNTKAGYAVVLLSATTPGNNNTQCFWTSIENLRTRQRGSDGTLADYGVLLKGTANATRITGGSFSHVNKAVGLTNDGVGTGMADSVVVDGVAFEAGPVLVAVDVVQTPGNLWPTGLRVCNCRVESTTTFFSMTTGGGAGLNHSTPPFLSGNYITNGSVTNYLVNPTSAFICSMDMQYTNAAPAPFRLQATDHFRFVSSGTAKNLIIANDSGNTAWNAAHLQLGEDAVNSMHLWKDGATGFIYVKSSAPANATDGVVISANGGRLPVVGLTITAAGGKIVPGATSLEIRDTADANSNLSILDGGAATFRSTVQATGYKVGANQVVGARVTGYAAMTGTPDKATAFATSTVTLAQLAGRVMQLQADITTHGLVGP